MQDGLSGFLKHVGSLTRFERLPINIEKIIHTVFRWLGIKIYQKKYNDYNDLYICQDLCSSRICRLAYYIYGDYTNNTKAISYSLS